MGLIVPGATFKNFVLIPPPPPPRAYPKTSPPPTLYLVTVLEIKEIFPQPESFQKD
jgi:hypothetical protein